MSQCARLKILLVFWDVFEIIYSQLAEKKSLAIFNHGNSKDCLHTTGNCSVNSL